MVRIPNRFYRGIVHSPKNPKHPNFRFLIIDTIYELQDENGNWITDSFTSKEQYYLHNPDHGDILYGIYGSFWIDIPKSCLKITETLDLNEAVIVAEHIMGTQIIDATNYGQ